MIYVIAYLVFCVGFAYLNSVWIKADKKINHPLNGALHVALWFVGWFVTKNILLVLALPFIGRLFFDTALNLFRGLPIGYVSEWVKANDKRSSVTDRAEWKVFKSGVTPKIVYLVIIIVLIVLYVIRFR